MDKRFGDLLEEGIERVVVKGENLEEFLARHPGEMRELGPLLEMALAAARASRVEPSPEFKARLRYRVQAAFQDKGRKRLLPLAWPRRLVAVVAAVLLFFLAGGGTALALSADSVPGEVLYPVKIAKERIQQAFTLSKGAKARLQVKFAEKRVNEIAKVAQRSRGEKVKQLSEKVAQHLEKAQQAVRSEVAKAKEEIKALLEEEAQKHLALLQGVLEEAPEEAKLPLRRAIERSKGDYEGTIRALGGPLPSLRLQMAAQAIAPDTIAGLITIANEGEVPAVIEGVEDLLFWKGEGEEWQQAREVILSSTPALKEGIRIPPGKAVKFEYKVIFTPLPQARELKKAIAIKVAGREGVFRDVVNLRPYADKGLLPGEKVEFRGVIESINRHWIVEGRLVLVTKDTLIEGKPKRNLIAEVEAEVRPDGSLIAKKIKIED